MPVASSELITIQSVSHGLIYLIFIISAKARAIKSRTIKIPLKSAAEFTQLLQPNDLRQSTHQSPMVAHKNLYAKNVLERPAVLKLLVLGLFRRFDKVKFSIDKRFQKRIIVAKAF